MDGSTPVRDRQDLVDRYQNDPSIPVFLLSTKACGLGITLTAADVCIIHDLDFNPFNDLQAQDRAHRVGQTKVVHVIKLVTKSTVDEHIYNIQEQKAKMNDAIMGSDEWKKQADKNMAEIVKAAVDDYLQSPH
jgi:SWI/SNF-related matrix-associated actin-dependent regulator 1 of chromatin subfamily A